MKVIKAFIRQSRGADLIHAPETAGGVAKRNWNGRNAERMASERNPEAL